jgi:hypothetical protein
MGAVLRRLHVWGLVLAVKAGLYLTIRESPVPWVDWVSDTEVAYLCQLVYRDPHAPARDNHPGTCPVEVGG